MNRDEIIRMAQQAGLFHFYDSEGHCDGITDARLVTEDTERDDDRLVEMLAPFAALVISHHDKANRPKPDASEREWLQQIAYQHGGIGDLCQTEFEFGAMVAAAEREECAQLCEQWNASHPEALAAAIRARGRA